VLTLPPWGCDDPGNLVTTLKEMEVDGCSTRLDFAVTNRATRTLHWHEDHLFVSQMRRGDRVALQVVAPSVFSTNIAREAWIMHASYGLVALAMSSLHLGIFVSFCLCHSLYRAMIVTNIAFRR
jgi:hypothetical protein